MAKNIQDQLVEIAPIMQVLLALGSGFALIGGALPETEFEGALGLGTQLPEGVSTAYGDYGGFARFLPRLFTAVLRDPPVLLLVLVLLLVGAGAFLVAREDSTLLTRGDPPAHPWVDSRTAAWCLAAAFLALVFSQIASYAAFEAPQRLANLGSRLQTPPDFDTTGWIDGMVERRHQRLYAAFFGLPEGEGASIVPPDFSPRTVLRHTPNQSDFGYLFSYYNGLATWTILTLIVLMTLTLVGSTMGRRSDSRRRRWTIAAAIVAATFLHVVQWTYLAYSYGRLYLPTLVLQRAASEVARSGEPQETGRWPFSRPALLLVEEKERLRIDTELVALRNYWPLRGDEGSDVVLAAGCNRAQRRQTERTWSAGDAEPLYRFDGVTVFTRIRVHELKDLCDEESEDVMLWLWDGYGEAASLPWETLRYE